MVQSNQAEAILEKVFLTPLDGHNSDACTEVGGFYVISGHNTPRWIVPTDSKLSKQVLDQWKPYGTFSQIAWFVLRRLYSFGKASLIPGIKLLSIEFASVLQLPGNNVDVKPVIYVGTPGSQQKAVVTLVDTKSGKALAVMKVALEVGAQKSLKREAEMLESLAQLGVKDTPKLLAVDEENGRTWQTVVAGCLSPRKLTVRHIDWLLSLPKSKKTTTFDKQKAILLGLVKQSDADLSSEQLTILNKIIEMIEGQKEIPLVLVHGDFAPWNIKQQKNGQLAVIDWEDAEFDGLPLWDLCHFHFIQAHLFGESKQLEAFLFGALSEQYLRGMEIGSTDKINLVRLYLLEAVLHKGANKSKEYQAFLIKQIMELPVQ